MSLCFDPFTSIDAKVVISADRPVAEPNLGLWDPHGLSFDTSDVRRQLGVLPVDKNHTERHVMELETTPEELREQVKIWYGNSQRKDLSEIVGSSQNLIRPFLKQRSKMGSFMCELCGLKCLGNGGNTRMEY